MRAHASAGASHNIFTAVALGDLDAMRSLAAVSRDAIDKPRAIWEACRAPLHLAVIEQQPGATIPVLLDLGANIEARDTDDLTPLDVAALRHSRAGNGGCLWRSGDGAQHQVLDITRQVIAGPIGLAVSSTADTRARNKI